MKTVAVSNLRAALSKYLRAVKAGQEVLITERGNPVAKIVPLTSVPISVLPHLEELEWAGLLRRGSGRLPPGFWDLPRAKDPHSGALKAMLAERDADPLENSDS